VALLIRVLTEGTQHLMTQREILNATVGLALNCYTHTVLVQFGVIILNVRVLLPTNALFIRRIKC
jgi:hypothetical protein